MCEDYLSRPLLGEIPVLKQRAKRHFGVHGYFTKQSWNVVAEYIKNYSNPGDVVLDPFGGSGVTAVEAAILGRQGVHVDLNPLSVFMVSALLAPVDVNAFLEETDRIKREFAIYKPETPAGVVSALAKYPYPTGIALPKKANVKHVEDLFTPKQLAQLAFLKQLILVTEDEGIRQSLLLAFSSTVTKINRTYHSSTARVASGGDASPFRYYRYRVVQNHTDLDVMHTFDVKCNKVAAAKRELSALCNDVYYAPCILKGNATALIGIEDATVDYIYTDPPYGDKIAYLDLSTMWNAWLDLEVADDDFDAEIIEGGSRAHDKSRYTGLLSASIHEMYRVLKFDRWLSLAFSHQDPAYWNCIVDAAERAGFEYVGTVRQSNGSATFKQRQNPFAVLSGQLILNFRKVRNPQPSPKVPLGADVSTWIRQTIDAVIDKNNGATIDEINDALVISGLNSGALSTLSEQYSSLTKILRAAFVYDSETKRYTRTV